MNTPQTIQETIVCSRCSFVFGRNSTRCPTCNTPQTIQETIVCSRCSFVFGRNSTRCPTCNAPRTIQETIVCSRCSFIFGRNSTRCPTCNTPQTIQDTIQETIVCSRCSFVFGRNSTRCPTCNAPRTIQDTIQTNTPRTIQDTIQETKTFRILQYEPIELSLDKMIYNPPGELDTSTATQIGVIIPSTTSMKCGVNASMYMISRYASSSLDLLTASKNLSSVITLKSCDMLSDADLKQIFANVSLECNVFMGKGHYKKWTPLAPVAHTKKNYIIVSDDAHYTLWLARRT
jgi:RNA polymerase subunit RPABC4/transcription elongation factor Spt4